MYGLVFYFIKIVFVIYYSKNNGVLIKEFKIILI